MVDHAKRDTLKTMTAAATVTAVPFTLTAGAATAAQATRTSPGGSVIGAIPGLEIDIESMPEFSTTWLRFSNETDKPVTVRYVSPGIVRSEGELYDLNSVLDGEALTIGPDEAYSWMVEPIADAAQATPLPYADITPFTASVTTSDGASVGDVLTPRLLLV